MRTSFRRDKAERERTILMAPESEQMHEVPEMVSIAPAAVGVLDPDDVDTDELYLDLGVGD